MKTQTSLATNPNSASNTPASRLPADWRLVRLGDVLKLRKDVVHPRNNPSGPATFVGLEHIESQTGRRIGAVELEMSRMTGRKPQFRKGEIVYGYLRPYLNKVWIAEFDGLCSVDQYVYEVNRDIADAEFVAWFMRSPTYLQRAPIDTTPGQLPRIRTEEVAAVKMELPPLTEQRRIAGRLREQLAEVAKARTAVQAQLAAANALPAACLMHVFDSPTATNWKTATIRDVSTLVVDGPHITPQYVDSGVPFLTIRNIVTRKINMTNVSYVSREDHTEFASRGRAERGDILYSKDGTLGIPCVVDTDAEFSFFVSVALIKLRRDFVVPRFVAAALESPKVLAQVASLGAGAGLKHMVLKSIRALEIPVPSLDDQHGIVARLAAELAEVTRLRESLSGKLEAIDRLPAALLAQAFQGGL